MPRPKDEDGISLAAAHLRLPEAPMLRQAGVLSLVGDGRLVFLTTARKVALCNRAIDHIWDGGTIPKSVDEPPMSDAWRRIVAAIRRARSPTSHQEDT